MLTSRIYRHDSEQWLARVSTKKIRLDDSAELYFQLTSEQSAIVALIESHIVEICAEHRGKRENDEIFFSKLLESLNRLILGQGQNASRSKLRSFIGIIRDSHLSFSVCGNYHAYLQQGEKIVNIADGMASKEVEFSYVSNGTIQPGDGLYISNRDLLVFLTQEDLEELALDHDPEIIENLISREASEDVIDCLVFFHEQEWEFSFDSIKKFNRSGPGFFDIFEEFSIKSWKSLRSGIRRLDLPRRYTTLLQHPRVQILIQKKEVRVGIFGTWIVIAIGLLILIIRSLFYTSMMTAVPEEYKNKLIEAQQILGRSSRDMANKELFKENLAKAESLVFEVRDKKVFANDVKSLLEQISVMKRQLNGIESYSFDSHPVDFNLPKDSEPIAVFENAKKLYAVGKKWVYGPFIKGNEAKLATLPDAEEAKSADMTAEGVLYILTNSNRVIKFSKGEFTYVNVEWQAAWQTSTSIHVFNGNLYLLSEDGTQIFRHRPSVTGFGSKSPLIDGTPPKNPFMYDFNIDSGFYVINSDLSIEKFFTNPSFSRKGLILNKLPDNYRQDGNTFPKIASSPTANFLYVLLDNRIWILEPDSRNFKDIRALKYIGQIEITGHQIYSIIVPKDGEITTLTEVGIATVKFEVSDNKINIR